MVNFEDGTKDGKKMFNFPERDNILDTIERRQLQPRPVWPDHMDFNLYFYHYPRKSSLSTEKQDRQHQVLQLPAGVHCLTNFSQGKPDFGLLTHYLGFHNRQAFTTFFYTYGE